MLFDRLSSFIRQETRGLPRQFWLLAGGTFVYIVGIYMTFPFKTLYMTGELGVSISTAGVIIGVVILAGVPFQLPAGALVDRLGRKPVMAGAVIGSILFCLILALSQNAWQAGLALLFDSGFGWPVFLTASSAAVADMVRPERRAEALSIVRTVVNVGMAVGPLLAAPLLAGSGTYRWSFAVGAAVCATFFVTLLMTFRETRPTTLDAGDSHAEKEALPQFVPVPEPTQALEASTFVAAEEAVPDEPDETDAAGGRNPPAERPGPRGQDTSGERSQPRSAPGGYRVVLRDRRFVVFCAVMLLPLYCLGQFWETLPVVLRNVQDVSAGQWGLLLTVFAATAAVLQYPLVRALRRRDPLVVLAVSSLLLTGGISGMVYAPFGWLTYLLVAVTGVGFVLLMPIGTGVVTHLAPVALRGRYLGVWTFVFIAGYSLGPLLGGFVISSIGPLWAFAVVALTGAAGAALLTALATALRARRPAL